MHGLDPADPVGNARMRVTLEFSRSDDPLLFDALAQLEKGRRRVARLRTLAHDGLLAGSAIAGASAKQGALPAWLPDGDDARGERAELAALTPRLTRGIFDDPIQE